MRFIFKILLLVILSNHAFGQVATIKDKDGWTNVREEPNGKSESIHKISENEIFWFDIDNWENGNDWIAVYIPKNKYSLGCAEYPTIEGFVHKSRLLPIDKMQKVREGEIQFKYGLSEFKKSNHNISWQDEQWISQINGRNAWGTDGNVPKTEVTGIQVTIREKNIQLDKVYFKDIFECTNEFEIYKDQENYFIHQWNSDGAGAYEIVWVINKNGLQQRLVGNMG